MDRQINRLVLAIPCFVFRAADAVVVDANVAAVVVVVVVKTAAVVAGISCIDQFAADDSAAAALVMAVCLSQEIDPAVNAVAPNWQTACTPLSVCGTFPAVALTTLVV